MKYYKMDTDGNFIEKESVAYKETLRETISDDITLTPLDSGKVFVVDTDEKEITLPATFKGEYTFINGGADGAVNLLITPNEDDAIFGSISASAGANADATTADGLISKASGADGASWQNTKATANKGDYCKLVGNGTTGWDIVAGIGIWTNPA